MNVVQDKRMPDAVAGFTCDNGQDERLLTFFEASLGADWVFVL